MSELDVLIGKRLQKARKALGFKSARSFAREHGIPESTYSQHETGKRSLNPLTLTSYCQKLSITPGWLITGDQHGAALNKSLLKSVLKKELYTVLVPNAQSQFDEIIKLCLTAYEQTIANQQLQLCED